MIITIIMIIMDIIDIIKIMLNYKFKSDDTYHNTYRDFIKLHNLFSPDTITFP
jgi:hypothetical protein